MKHAVSIRPKHTTIVHPMEMNPQEPLRESFIGSWAKKDQIGKLSPGGWMAFETDHAKEMMTYWQERNLEVDFVLQRGDTIVAIEVKSGVRKQTLPCIAAFDKAHQPTTPPANARRWPRHPHRRIPPNTGSPLAVLKTLAAIIGRRAPSAPFKIQNFLLFPSPFPSPR